MLRSTSGKTSCSYRSVTYWSHHSAQSSTSCCRCCRCHDQSGSRNDLVRCYKPDGPGPWLYFGQQPTCEARTGMSRSPTVVCYIIIAQNDIYAFAVLIFNEQVCESGTVWNKLRHRLSHDENWYLQDERLTCALILEELIVYLPSAPSFGICALTQLVAARRVVMNEDRILLNDYFNFNSSLSFAPEPKYLGDVFFMMSLQAYIGLLSHIISPLLPSKL